MAELFVGPIIDKIIETCFDYVKDQLSGQTNMKEALERLKKRLPIIRSVVSAYYRAQIRGQDPDLDRWIWQIRDAIDGADDLLDEFEYLKHKEQLKETKNFLSKSARKILKVGKRALKIDSNLKRLEEVVQNLDEISAEVLCHHKMSSSQSSSSKGFMEDQIMTCRCNLQCVLYTCYKGDNAGKKIFRCPHNRTKKDCGYFIWVDDFGKIIYDMMKQLYVFEENTTKKLGTVSLKMKIMITMLMIVIVMLFVLITIVFYLVIM